MDSSQTVPIVHFLALTSPRSVLTSPKSHSGRTYLLLLHKNQLIIVNRLLETCMGYCGQGFIKPIKPLQLFEATHIEEAFRFMQKGQHIGKIVVSMPQDQKELPTSFNSSAAYTATRCVVSTRWWPWGA